MKRILMIAFNAAIMIFAVFALITVFSAIGNYDSAKNGVEYVRK